MSPRWVPLATGFPVGSFSQRALKCFSAGTCSAKPTPLGQSIHSGQTSKACKIFSTISTLDKGRASRHERVLFMLPKRWESETSHRKSYVSAKLRPSGWIFHCRFPLVLGGQPMASIQIALWRNWIANVWLQNVELILLVKWHQWKAQGTNMNTSWAPGNAREIPW